MALSMAGRPLLSPAACRPAAAARAATARLLGPHRPPLRMVSAHSLNKKRDKIVTALKDFEDAAADADVWQVDGDADAGAAAAADAALSLRRIRAATTKLVAAADTLPPQQLAALLNDIRAAVSTIANTAAAAPPTPPEATAPPPSPAAAAAAATAPDTELHKHRARLEHDTATQVLPWAIDHAHLDSFYYKVFFRSRRAEEVHNSRDLVENILLAAIQREAWPLPSYLSYPNHVRLLGKSFPSDFMGQEEEFEVLHFDDQGDCVYRAGQWATSDEAAGGGKEAPWRRAPPPQGKTVMMVRKARERVPYMGADEDGDEEYAHAAGSEFWGRLVNQIHRLTGKKLEMCDGEGSVAKDWCRPDQVYVRLRPPFSEDKPGDGSGSGGDESDGGSGSEADE